MAVTIDFGDFSAINMLQPGPLGGRILSGFDGFDFRTGEFNAALGRLEIPSTSDPAAYVLAYGNWDFNPDGTPSDGSTVFAIEVWDSSGYRVVMDGFGVFFPTLRSALEDNDLSTLYAGHPLEILGAQTFSDTLAGGSRNDELYGYGGHDVLFGKGGSDYLDGMGGADTMQGGRGGDDYVVNNAGDVVDESDGEGIDLVIALIDYTLPDFVEDLAMRLSAGALEGTGNSEHNFMAGNGSANTLRGLAGNDTLVGGASADVLEGGDDRDSLVGGEGSDRLDGGAGADRLSGGRGNDVLVWDEDDTRVHGGIGTADVLLLSGDLDLRAVADGLIVDIERIGLSGGDYTLILNRSELLDLSSSTDVLRVLGEAGDTVDITSAFTQRGDLDGFTRYDVRGVTLWVDSDIQVI